MLDYLHRSSYQRSKSIKINRNAGEKKRAPCVGGGCQELMNPKKSMDNGRNWNHAPLRKNAVNAIPLQSTVIRRGTGKENQGFRRKNGVRTCRHHAKS